MLVVLFEKEKKVNACCWIKPGKHSSGLFTYAAICWIVKMYLCEIFVLWLSCLGHLVNG